MFLRAIVYALIGIFLITFIRLVIGMIVRGLSDLMKGESGMRHASASRSAGSAPVTGHLKACTRCGTYVLETAAMTRVVDGETAYYCSAKCRDA